MSNSTTVSSVLSNKTILKSGDPGTTKDSGHHLSTGAIVGIVIGCLALIVVLLIIAFILYKRIQKRRKNHGEYRPQQEEEIHGKGLPPIMQSPTITPPGTDGLI
ncbi:hypothetical protein M3Y97_00257200 [Aphelenchoides bicaudatus]|nr:hypothetical protein M3Y97_00257200 [Aphelenchoides bicaudatus]